MTLKIKFYLICLFVCISILFNFLNVLDSEPTNRLKFDGLRYNSIVQEYINGGYSFSAVTGSLLTDDLTKEEYASRVGYTWLAATIYRITHIDLVNIYLAISLLFFMGTAIVLMKIGSNFYQLSLLETFACGLLFAAFPAVHLIFEIGAHPDAPFFFFSCLAMYCFYKKQHLVAAISIMIALLFKRAAIAVPVYVIALSIASYKTKPIKYLHLIYYIAAVLYAYLLPKLLLSNLSYHSNYAEVFKLIVTYNRGNLFAYFLYNFQLLSFPFLIFALNRPLAEKLALSAVLLMGLLAHVYNVVDWFRVWFGLLFIWAIPYAVAYFARFKPLLGNNGLAVLYIFLLFGIYQSPALLDIEKMRAVPVATYSVLLFIILVLEVMKHLGIGSNKDEQESLAIDQQ